MTRHGIVTLKAANSTVAAVGVSGVGGRAVDIDEMPPWLDSMQEPCLAIDDGHLDPKDVRSGHRY